MHPAERLSLVFLVAVLAGACQRHGVGGFVVKFIIINVQFTTILVLCEVQNRHTHTQKQKRISLVRRLGPAWFSFWLSGCWRALAKGTAWAVVFIVQFTIITVVAGPKKTLEVHNHHHHHCWCRRLGSYFFLLLL